MREDEEDDNVPASAGYSGAGAGHGRRTETTRFLTGLFDFQMREIVTTRMLPVIYGFAVAGAALMSLFWIAWGFQQSWAMGLGWLILFGPALFLAVVIAVRVFLEFVLTVFRIAVFLETLGGQIESIADQTGDIAQDLPRIRFWRSRK